MQTNGTKIFVGLKISEKLQEQLDSSNASAKQFFDESDPQYLQMIQIDHDDCIGKTTKSGASLEDLSNMLLNVKSILRMICPRFSLPDKAIKIFSVAPKSERTYL